MPKTWQTQMSQPLKLAAILALAALPLVEIGLLIWLGQSIGFWRLALLILLTAILGAYVIRHVGLSIFGAVLKGTRASRDGFEPLFNGFLQVLAGLLLIFPGIISDSLGLLLLIPIVRRQIIRSGLLKLVNIFHYQAEVSREAFRTPADDAGFDDDSSVTIEGEYERVSEKTVRTDKAVRPRNIRN